ncbi:7TM diverse intracellular signaling domain-containing protein [Maribacter sp. 2210JD10-5]|uniref:hybrid sensor histidine kinase/response regulator n=1 Tax=Maribacter sp. 2210JD10-5 TaxID=3386272 RepID=UPI0039BD0E2E
MALLFSVQNLVSQYHIDEPIKEAVSLHEHASILNTGGYPVSVEEIILNKERFNFIPFQSATENIGFTDEHYWVKFKLVNNTTKELNYYLETARPIIDFVNLYSITENGIISEQKNGDAIAFDMKSLPHRKVFFKLDLLPKTIYTGYVQIKSDGEALNIPLRLTTPENLLENTYNEQIFFGLFYGILLLAFTVYLFFYFGLRNSLFTVYSIYILFVGLLQFAVDGFFHQYITPSGGWLNDRAVILIANISLLFFLKYGGQFLEVSKVSHVLDKIYFTTCTLLLATVTGIVLLPKFLSYAYPITNILGIIVLSEIISAIIIRRIKKKKTDIFFILGIFFLIMGFIVFILNNLNILPHSFYSENGPKFGTALEIIFLSISMSNRIKLLRLENEKNHAMALQRAEDLNDIKSYFLSNLSHELRTPLNLIMGVASSIENDAESNDSKEKAGLITASSKSLLSAINDIVDYTDIEKGNYKLQEAPLNPREILEAIEKTIAPRAKEKNLTFKFPSLNNLPREIIGDAKKIVQILTNLLDNAIKFTPNGTVELEIKHTISKNNRISFSFFIIDTGIGITKEKMNTIFESFSKHSSNDKREFEGLGLGLYVVKTCVDLQKGSITINQNANGGTTCTVKLDFDIVPEEKSEHISMEDRNILLVEDNKMNQMVIKLFVKKWKGVSLSIANNGQEGLDLLEKNNFDLVFMDLQMPVMDGFEAIEKIRSGLFEHINGQVPIIVITADCTAESYKKAKSLGADDYMTKPIKENILLEKADKALDKSFKKAV